MCILKYYTINITDPTETRASGKWSGVGIARYSNTEIEFVSSKHNDTLRSSHSRSTYRRCISRRVDDWVMMIMWFDTNAFDSHEVPSYLPHHHRGALQSQPQTSSFHTRAVAPCNVRNPSESESLLGARAAHWLLDARASSKDPTEAYLLVFKWIPRVLHNSWVYQISSIMVLPNSWMITSKYNPTAIAHILKYISSIVFSVTNDEMLVFDTIVSRVSSFEGLLSSFVRFRYIDRG